MRFLKKRLKITVLSSSNNTVRMTIEAVISNDNILYMLYLCITNCNMTTKLWGLGEKRHDEVIRSISQSLITSMKFQGF